MEVVGQSCSDIFTVSYNNGLLASDFQPEQIHPFPKKINTHKYFSLCKVFFPRKYHHPIGIIQSLRESS